ncbi:MAG: AbrB/MazE/SpoVT family DNA-binding domain-containing protein [Gammaproteobacteria bacterium]|nr:AbrB/MazE/SpoVT family DNA-binding domain-containing protein [Gammaproteobacteria bacterium]
MLEETARLGESCGAVPGIGYAVANTPSLPVPTLHGTKERISNYFHARPAMPLVTVKPKFQVTIPAKLRKSIDLHEGDLMEATIVGDGILLRPKEVVDRDAAADRIASILARVEPSSEDTGRSENEIMEDIIADIAEARRERRVHRT